MKTFKQWVDSFPENIKEYIFRLSPSFDPKSPTYYTCDNHRVGPEILLSLIENKKQNESYYRRHIDTFEAYGIIVGFLVDRISGKNNALPGISDDVIYNAILTLMEYSPGASYISCLPLKYQRELINRNCKEDGGITSIAEILLLTEDFDNIPWDLLNSEKLYRLSDELCTIIPKEKLLAFLKKDFSLLPVRNIEPANELFDTLFFLKDGWTASDKQEIIKGFAGNIEGFIKNVVAVDKYYLKYLPLVLKDAGTARRLYSLKKPAEEITEDTPLQETFRYSKEYRRLFMIVRCCNEKSMSKEFARKIGNVSSLVKFYDYDYNMIFNAMYPEYAI